jgi:DNA-binding LacI/PurR family transcriptional regulator
MAASLLLRMIEGESLGVTQVELSTSLVIRESCAPPLGDFHLYESISQSHGA